MNKIIVGGLAAIVTLAIIGHKKNQNRHTADQLKTVVDDIDYTTVKARAEGKGL